MGAHSRAAGDIHADVRRGGSSSPPQEATCKGEATGVGGGRIVLPISTASSLMTTEIDARQIYRKNAKALRLELEQSVREAEKRAVADAKAAKLVRQQNSVVRRMVG